jgi:hypothetical protein
MKNLPKSPKHHVQTGEQTLQTEEVKAAETSSLKPKLTEAPIARQSFPIWQVTVPLGGVLIFAISSLTAYFMVEGRFIFDLYVSPKQIKIKADVDKRDSGSSKQGIAPIDRENAGSTR